MLDSILGAATGAVTLGEIAVCTAVSLALGALIAWAYLFRNVYTKNFVVTLALLPAMIQSVIMVVNGNLGTGVAVMGAFSLIRFRSAPGSAREITAVFFSMAVGLAMGMGYVVYAALFTAIMAAAMVVYSLTRFGEQGAAVKSLRVTIPEDLDYGRVFDDLFAEYTRSATLERVRTTNLGGLYELQYTVHLKQVKQEKEFLDHIRQRNGNLSLTCGRKVATRDEL